MTVEAVLVTGAAGFLGRHLVKHLCFEGQDRIVLGVDNFYSSEATAVEELKVQHRQFHFLKHDVRNAFPGDYQTRYRLTEIYHLACPASPPHYGKDELYTLDTAIYGTRNVLELAKLTHARVLIASTSEVYGDPEVHPQTETYRGAVNTWGPRACYDEGKRTGETLAYIFSEKSGVSVRVARIFNTYGPGMSVHDGRVMTEFLNAAREGKPYPIFGDGKQTRSFCYVDDLIRGLQLLMRSECLGPVNLGNTQETSVLELAHTIHELYGKGPFKAKHIPLPQDDPKRRRPDTTRAWRELSWKPEIGLRDGIALMMTGRVQKPVKVSGKEFQRESSSRVKKRDLEDPRGDLD